MKNFGFLILSSFIYSCTEDICPKMEPCIETEMITDSTTKIYGSVNFTESDNMAYAIKVNDTTWFKVFAASIKNYSEYIYINLIGYWDNRTTYESMSISIIPKKVGCYSIVELIPPFLGSTKPHAQFNTADADIVLDEYVLDTSVKNNKIEIIRIDTINKLIEGKFAVSFVYLNNRPKINPNDPVKLRYFNGYFKGPLNN